MQVYSSELLVWCGAAEVAEMELRLNASFSSQLRPTAAAVTRCLKSRTPAQPEQGIVLQSPFPH
jgi:hypothetical protein